MHTNCLLGRMTSRYKESSHLGPEPDGHTHNLDLNMAGLLLLWLIVEVVCDFKPTPT
jgi:hypothetical protein